MKKYFIFLLYFFIQNTIGQNFMAKYQVVWQGYNVKNFLLIKNDSLSLWYVVTNSSEEVKDTTVTFFGKQYNTYETIQLNEAVYDTYSFKKFVLREYNKREIIFTDIFRHKRLFVRDSFFDMHWNNIGREYKIINGHRCQSAETTFRGRKYKAFFAPDIPVNTGPWKFNNLPGLIVEVKSLDGEYLFRLNELKIYNNQVAIQLPEIPYDKLWDWKKYVTKIRKYYDDKIAYSRAKHRQENSNTGGAIKISRIEIIHPIFSPAGVQLYEMTHEK